MNWPVVAYAPKAATKPSIAAQPLNFSASGVMAKMKYELNIKKNNRIPWVFTHGIRLWELIVPIRKVYLIIEVICAECNLSSRSFFLAKWLFKLEELVLHLEARFNSDWCIAFLFAFCLSSRIFNSVELEWQRDYVLLSEGLSTTIHPHLEEDWKGWVEE